MSNPSKLYADKGRIQSSHGGPQASQKRSESPKARNTDRLRQAILEAIGEPDDLSHVDVKRLHSDCHYRVNVYREVKQAVRMTDSYYVVALNDAVISSNPPMKKKYHDADLGKLFKTL